MAFCTHCGSELSDQAVICPACGNPGPAAARPVAPAAAGAYGGYQMTAAQPGQMIGFAGWWQRAAALLLDGLIVAIPSVILMAIFSVGFVATGDFEIDPVTGELVGGDAGAVAGMLVSMLVIVVIGILYRVLLEGGRRGQTVGKMALKIAVRDAETGGPIGYGRAAVRWLVASVLWMLFYVPGIVDVLFPLWDERKQSLHDKAARSVVVQVT